MTSEQRKELRELLAGCLLAEEDGTFGDRVELMSALWDRAGDFDGLLDALDEAERALEFYADEETWKRRDGLVRGHPPSVNEDGTLDLGTMDRWQIRPGIIAEDGGTRARIALSKIRGDK